MFNDDDDSCGCGKIFSLDAWRNPGPFCRAARATIKGVIFLVVCGYAGWLAGPIVIRMLAGG